MFMKYPSLTNHYQQKDIDRFLQCVPPNFDTQYAVFEKIDGSNISFLIHPDEDKIRYFSRNQEITGSNFYGSEDVFQEVISELTELVCFVKDTKRSVRLFGELYGPSIQKRIDYGAKKNIVFFDVMIDDELVAPYRSTFLLEQLKLDHRMIEPLAIYHDFETAWSYNENFDTLFGPIKEQGNRAEGIVIKPWNAVFFTPAGSVFMVKKKSKEFADKMARPQKKEKQQFSAQIEKIKRDFLEYVNDNTVQSVFSKHGEIQSHKEIGKYIPLIIQDAIDTFDRETQWDSNDLEKNERKYIFNCSGEVVELLKKYL